MKGMWHWSEHPVQSYGASRELPGSDHQVNVVMLRLPNRKLRNVGFLAAGPRAGPLGKSADVHDE